MRFNNVAELARVRTHSYLFLVRQGFSVEFRHYAYVDYILCSNLAHWVRFHVGHLQVQGMFSIHAFYHCAADESLIFTQL